LPELLKREEEIVALDKFRNKFDFQLNIQGVNGVNEVNGTNGINRTNGVNGANGVNGVKGVNVAA
jgi:hypothetical protein